MPYPIDKPPDDGGKQYHDHQVPHVPERSVGGIGKFGDHAVVLGRDKDALVPVVVEEGAEEP